MDVMFLKKQSENVQSGYMIILINKMEFVLSIVLMDIIVCAYLTEDCGMSLNDAVKLFKEKRPSVELLNENVIIRVFIDLKFSHN